MALRDSSIENTNYCLWDHKLWFPTVQVPNANSGFSTKEILSMLFLLRSSEKEDEVIQYLSINVNTPGADLAIAIRALETHSEHGLWS